MSNQSYLSSNQKAQQEIEAAIARARADESRLADTPAKSSAIEPSPTEPSAASQEAPNDAYPVKPSEDEHGGAVPTDEIRRLALLKQDPFQYDIALNELAQQYRGLGVRKDTLRELVNAELHRYHTEQARQAQAEQQRRIAAAPPVDGEKLLCDLEALIDQFIWMDPSRRTILAAWITHTWSCRQVASFTPYMHVRSPIKRCAKTLTELISKLLVWNPVFAASMSNASLVSNVSGGCTLLLDEVDTIFQGPVNEATEQKRGILNAGYEREGTSHKMVKDPGTGDWVSEPYSVFGPKMIAGIGHLPDTVEDRSFDILLLRKPKHVIKERFIRTNSKKGQSLRAKFAELRQRIELWTAQNLDKLKEAEPDLSAIADKIDDRALEIAEPLIAIADLCGGDWPRKIREAVVAVKSGHVPEDDSLGTRVLVDIRRCLTSSMCKEGKIFTRTLTLWLAGQDAWRNFHGHGQPLQQRKLLGILRDFEIHQKSVWIDGQRDWGFDAAQFTDAFEALPPAENYLSVVEISVAEFADPITDDD
jgi:hypothetical protein